MNLDYRPTGPTGSPCIPQRVALATGCFDLLHPGHLHLFHYASRLADRLVVGLNSDASIQRLKGPTRPIMCQEARVAMVSAIRWVDQVIVFDEDDVVRLLGELRPAVWVKGAGWTLDNMHQGERRMAESIGCHLQFCPLVPGISTTDIVESIKKSAAT